MKKILISFVLLQFVVVVFGQSVNAPNVAEKLLTTNKQNAKAVLQSMGFSSVLSEKKSIADAGGLVLTVVSGVYKNHTSRCELYFSDGKTTPDMVFIQYNEYENMDVLCKIYEKVGYTISERDIKPAYMNTEGRDRTILKWAKQVGNKILSAFQRLLMFHKQIVVR